MRGRLFSYIAAASLLLCLASAWVWYSALRSYVSEADRIERQGREITEAINREPWNSPAYWRRVAEYNSWTAARDDYRRREPQVRAAYHRRYIVVPLALVIALAVPPTLWLALFWRRCERQWAQRPFDPPTRGRWARQVAFTTAAAACLVLSLAIAACWARSYFVTDSFYFHRFFDEGDRTFWRQTVLESGRGSVLLDGHLSSAGSRREIADAYALYVGTSIPRTSSHSTYPSRSIYPGIRRKWGFAWRYFQRDRTAYRLAYSGYSCVVPFWSLELVSLAVPSFWFWRRLRRGRLVRPGHCRCGYNLTANTSGICPECGATVSNATNAPSSLPLRSS